MSDKHEHRWVDRGESKPGTRYESCDCGQAHRWIRDGRYVFERFDDSRQMFSYDREMAIRVYADG